MPVTVLAPGSFATPETTQSWGDLRQRVVLGGSVDGDRQRLDGAAVFDATLDEEHDSSRGLKAASVDVHGGDACSLLPVDMAKLEQMAASDTDYEEGLSDDHSSLLLCGDSSPESMEVKTGDLRFMVRWEQRGGKCSAGEGIAYLCRRIQGGPPALKEPCPLDVTRAGREERFQHHISNLGADNF